jgi:hypothetical protein
MRGWLFLGLYLKKSTAFYRRKRATKERPMYNDLPLDAIPNSFIPNSLSREILGSRPKEGYIV